MIQNFFETKKRNNLWGSNVYRNSVISNMHILEDFFSDIYSVMFFINPTTCVNLNKMIFNDITSNVSYNSKSIFELSNYISRVTLKYNSIACYFSIICIDTCVSEVIKESIVTNCTTSIKLQGNSYKIWSARKRKPKIKGFLQYCQSNDHKDIFTIMINDSRFDNDDVGFELEL